MMVMVNQNLSEVTEAFVSNFSKVFTDEPPISNLKVEYLSCYERLALIHVSENVILEKLSKLKEGKRY